MPYELMKRGSHIWGNPAEWDRLLDVGDTEIDFQHTRIFQAAATYEFLYLSGDQDFTGAALDEFVSYILMHFIHEEELMEKIGYPNRQEHVAAHRSLTREVDELRGQAHVVTPKETMDMVHKFLNHILDVDSQYAPWVKAEGEGGRHVAHQ